jgi:hypothetical protein
MSLVVNVPDPVHDPVLAERHQAHPVVHFRFKTADAMNQAAKKMALIDWLVASGLHDGQSGQVVGMQAMADLRHDVMFADPGAGPSRGVSYLAAYEGTDKREGAHADWVCEYLNGHVPLMHKLAHVEELQVHRRVPWEAPGHVQRIDWLLRSSVYFSSRENLQRALDSPERKMLYAHRKKYLPAIGCSSHVAMWFVGESR